MAERRAGSFVDPDVDPRTDPPFEGDERTILSGFLRWQRETLALGSRAAVGPTT